MWTCRKRGCDNPKSNVVGHYGRCISCYENSERERIAKEERRVERIRVREERVRVREERAQARQERQLRAWENKREKISKKMNGKLDKILNDLNKFMCDYGTSDTNVWDYDSSETETGKLMISIVERRLNLLLHPPEPSGRYECPVCFNKTDSSLSCGHALCDGCISKILSNNNLNDSCPMCRKDIISG